VLQFLVVPTSQRTRLMFEKRDLFRAIGELAYVIAKSDGLKLDEKKAFYDIIEKELRFESWAAQSRFDLMDEELHTTMEHAYNDAMHEFKKSKHLVDQELVDKALRVFRAVASACNGTSEVEEFIISRFESDIKQLMHS
jgi:tellurite resistance protein